MNVLADIIIIFINANLDAHGVATRWRRNTAHSNGTWLATRKLIRILAEVRDADSVEAAIDIVNGRVDEWTIKLEAAVVQNDELGGRGLADVIVAEHIVKVLDDLQHKLLFARIGIAA